jgi:hypothetical protein
MAPVFRRALALLVVSLSILVLAQDNDDDGYEGYNLDRRGDAESAVYETANTHTGVDVLSPEPDVYLNASVGVDIISIEVDNITAKVNLDAQVLNLLHFSAGVDASIDRVRLTIENISAQVELEARLENVVEMIGDVLHSIDLNPIIATLGKDVNKIVNNLTGTLGQTVDQNGKPVSRRDVPESNLEYKMEHNILYSVNDYSDRTHTNRVLAQNGSIIDVFLDNEGDENGQALVGYYSRDMTFNGHNRTITIDGKVAEYELQYVYQPYPGLEVVSNVYMNPAGKVTRTRVIAEAEGGGTSTISDDDDEEDL